jgi:hypothetical protein
MYPLVAYVLLLRRFLVVFLRGGRGRDGMAVVSSNAVYGELYSIQHYDTFIRTLTIIRQHWHIIEKNIITLNFEY